MNEEEVYSCPPFPPSLPFSLFRRPLSVSLSLSLFLSLFLSLSLTLTPTHTHRPGTMEASPLLLLLLRGLVPWPFTAGESHVLFLLLLWLLLSSPRPWKRKRSLFWLTVLPGCLTVGCQLLKDTNVFAFERKNASSHFLFHFFIANVFRRVVPAWHEKVPPGNAACWKALPFLSCQ